MFRPRNIMEHLPQLMDFLQIKYNRIKKSGEKDKLQWNSEAQVYVLNEVLREGVQMYFQNEVFNDK